MYFLTLFVSTGRLLDRRDGRTLILVVAAALLAASTEFVDLAGPALDESCTDQASLDLGAATVALASSSRGREWLRRAILRDSSGCGASAAGGFLSPRPSLGALNARTLPGR